MKYTEVIPAMQKCAANPVSGVLKFLSRLVYGTDFDEDEREGKERVGNAMGQAFSNVADTLIDVQKAAPDFKPTTAPAPKEQSDAGDAYTKFKEQHNTNN